MKISIPNLRRNCKFATICVTSLSASSLFSQSVFDTSDANARHYLSYYVDELAAKDVLTTTWPMSDADIRDSIAKLDEGSLNLDQRIAKNKLEGYLDRFSENTRYEASGYYASNPEPLPGFSSNQREEAEITFSVSKRVSIFHGKLNVSGVSDTIFGDEVRLDNSYIAADIGNWTAGFGAIDRWWGPAWQSGLILSNNARPSPGFFLNRRRSKAFNIPVLKALGPWSFSAFANQLEEERHVPNAKLLGARFTFKPTKNLEIGLSRTAQWGGDGRPETWDNLVELILGRDNSDNGIINEDRSNEPGNQLGGIDWRWKTKFLNRNIALYGQIIGEDEAGSVPSREIGMFGIEAPWTSDKSHGRVYLEASDTTLKFWSDPTPNSTYNHGIYQSGYRSYAESIGASTDNDTRSVTLGGYHDYHGKHSIDWKIFYGHLNRDGVEGGNTVSPEEVETTMIQFKWLKPISESASFALSGYYLTNSIPNDNISDSGVSLSFHYIFR